MSRSFEHRLRGILPGRVDGLFASVAFASFLLSIMPDWFDFLRDPASADGVPFGWASNVWWRFPYAAMYVLAGMLTLLDLWLLFGDRTFRRRLLVAALLSIVPPVVVLPYLRGAEEHVDVSVGLCVAFVSNRLAWLGGISLCSLVLQACIDTRIVVDEPRCETQNGKIGIADLLLLTTVFAIAFGLEAFRQSLPKSYFHGFVETQMAPNWAYYTTCTSMSGFAFRLGLMEWKPLLILASATLVSQRRWGFGIAISLLAFCCGYAVSKTEMELEYIGHLTTKFPVVLPPVLGLGILMMRLWRFRVAKICRIEREPESDCRLELVQGRSGWMLGAILFAAIYVNQAGN